MTTLQRDTLTRFADARTDASRWEALGPGAPAGTDAAVHALMGAGLLVALPYRTTRDPHGGTRFRVPPAGYTALGRAAPTPGPTRARHKRHAPERKLT